MALTIPDEWLVEAGLSEKEIRIEIACRLYDSGRLSFAQSIRWSGLNRVEFEEALLTRCLPVVRPNLNTLMEDIETIGRLGTSTCPS